MSLWKSKTGSAAGEQAIREILQILDSMCNGPQLCMYCEGNEATDIEHIKPRSRYPSEAFKWKNYLYACTACNSRFKGDLYHPGFLDPSSSGFDLWQHWIFDPHSGHYSAASETDAGAVETLRILGFERRDGLARRRQGYIVTLVIGIREYAKMRARGRPEKAREIARSFRLQFPAIVEWVLAGDAAPEVFPDVEIIRKVKTRFPEIVQDALG